MDEQEDVIREFLIESNENLTRLDQELVRLERQPGDLELLASIFRVFHTIKGTCGFLAFTKLEGVAHEAENLLAQLRSGERGVTPGLISLILETVDAIRGILQTIEKTGREPDRDSTELIERLRQGLRETNPILQTAVPQAPRVSKTEPTPAATPRESQAAAPAEKTSSVADSTIRVDVALLDKLMNLVGELVLARNQVLQFNGQHEDATLNATSQRLNLITTELQEGVMKTRMQPIGVVWHKLPRMVRDLALSLGKQVQLEMDGADTELDRTIIEAIKDPLTHLVRNCCDHGIESPQVRAKKAKPAQGRISLRSYHEGGHVNIEIRDDGGGIDVARLKQRAVEKAVIGPEHAGRLTEREALNLIFLPGFSMAECVTNISGRGVGMDVVKKNVERIGGVIDIGTGLGTGTSVRLKIPLTLAIIPGLVIVSGDQRFVIPQVSLVELIRLERDSTEHRIEWIHETPVYRRRGSLLPITYLNKVLDLGTSEESEAINIVVLQSESRNFGLVVDGIMDTQEIVVKPLSKQLKGLSTYAGATIMGDGRVALILDVSGIGEKSGVFAGERAETRNEADGRKQTDARQRMLLFRAGGLRRVAVPLSLVARLEEFPQSSIEHAGNCSVVQYRDRILPLISLAKILSPDTADATLRRDPVQSIVINDGDRMLGIVVEEILDILEDVIKVRQSGVRNGLLGSAVLGGRVTDLLDLNAIIHSAADLWDQQSLVSGARKTVLVAEPSAFSRGLLRSAFEMAGIGVVEAGDLTGALRSLDGQQSVDAVLAAIDLPPDGGRKLLGLIRQHPKLAHIPVIAATNSASESRGAPVTGFDDCQTRDDHAHILESLQRLMAAVSTRVDETIETR